MTGKVEFRAAFCAVASLFCLAAVAERQPIDRYQSIIDRQMFGQPPPNFDPTKPPSQVQKGAGDEKMLTREQEAIKSAIHFSAINVTPAGDIAVGFTDNSDSKLPVHYYLKVGEERNGWKVLEADPVKATMKVAKGDIEVALDLGANSAKGGGSTARAGASAAPAIATAGRRPSLLASRRPAGLAADSVMSGASLRERRAARERARQEEAAKEKELEDQRKAEAAEKEKEREAQRQAEREEQRRELQLLKDELKAQREAVERAREEREAARRNENAEDES